MADNVVVTPGVGASIATDDVSSVHYQKVKQNYGVDGASAEGGSAYRSLDLGVTGQVVKASAARLLRLIIMNQHATLRRYVKVYNKATAATDADIPIFTFPVEPLKTTPIDFGEAGALFSSGISLRASTAIADIDVGAPAANDVVVGATYV